MRMTGMNTKKFFTLIAALSVCVVVPLQAQESAATKTSTTTKKSAKDASTTSTTKAGTKTDSAAKPSGPVQNIDVSLGSTGTTLSKTSIPSGRVAFLVQNNTELTHKISITGGSLKGADIDVTPNRAGKAEMDLAPGTYVVGCTLKDHMEAKARLTVK